MSEATINDGPGPMGESAKITPELDQYEIDTEHGFFGRIKIGISNIRHRNDNDRGLALVDILHEDGLGYDLDTEAEVPSEISDTIGLATVDEIDDYRRLKGLEDLSDEEQKRFERLSKLIHSKKLATTVAIGGAALTVLGVKAILKRH